MTYPMENLTPQLVKPLESEVRLGQGIIRSWDNETFENVVEWRGQELTNVNVLAGTDALSYRAGDPVVLIGNGLGMGTSSWFILGRAVVPGPGTGSEVVEFMQSSLVSQLIDDIVTQLLTSPAGEDLAAFVMAQRVSVSIFGSGTRSSTTYGDLDYGSGPQPGVTVTANITDSGKALVGIGSRIIAGQGTDQSGGEASVEVTGATSLGPGFVTFINSKTSDPGSIVGTQVGGMSFAVYTLNPGSNTFTGKYRSLEAGAPPVGFGGNTLVVFAL